MILSKILNLKRYFKKGQPSLKERFQSFQVLLHANNDALMVMGDLGIKYFPGEYNFNRRYMRESYNRIRENVSQMIEALNRMVPDKYHVLYEVLDRINSEIQETVFGIGEIPVSPLTISFNKITKDMKNAVGDKNANLGEMRNHVGLPIPDGFAISTHAYQVFVKNKIIEKDFSKQLAALDIHDQEAVSEISNRIREAIIAVPIPNELEEAILRSYGELAASEGAKIPVSIRSSGVGEDGDVSFAGQYATILNVRPEDILQSYKKVIDSKFTTQAIFYWKEMGFNEEDIPMAVGCQVMVPAKTSGVMFSRDPNHPDREVIIISAIRGLGELDVALATTNVYVVSREQGSILDKRVPRQETMLISAESGVAEVPVPDELRDQPCLAEEEIRKLCRFALQLEAYYQSPRDIEWVIDEGGKIFILQTRELLMSPPMEEQQEDTSVNVDADRVLINWGLVASSGLGAGPVHIVLRDRDLSSFPKGGVLVVKGTRPKYVTVMDKASAIIAEIGDVANHMSSLAREYQVPTIIDAKDATKLLRNGQMVTVDAYHNRVYEGVIEELISSEVKKQEDLRRKTPIMKKMEQLISRTVTLNLWDTNEESFKVENCLSFHDLTRLMHEMSIREMFHINEWKRGADEQSIQLVSEIPINLYIIDLGGGIALIDTKANHVRPEDIASRPMQALWRGISHPKIRWTGMVEVDLKGFASVMLNTLSDSARYGTQLGEKNYAIISKEYLNFSSRLAYHFSTVDAYCSEVTNENYISFQFMGGGSSSERRARRARFIAGVLNKLDFEVEVRGDWLQARLMKHECKDIETKLDYLGRLMCCTRQLDMAMYSDSVVDWYVKAFMEGNYTFQKKPAT